MGAAPTASLRTPKVDQRTGELLFFNYSKHAPFMHYGVVGPDGKLRPLCSGATARTAPAARHDVHAELVDIMRFSAVLG